MEKLGLAWDVQPVPERIYREAVSGSAPQAHEPTYASHGDTEITETAQSFLEDPGEPSVRVISVSLCGL